MKVNGVSMFRRGGDRQWKFVTYSFDQSRIVRDGTSNSMQLTSKAATVPIRTVEAVAPSFHTNNTAVDWIQNDSTLCVFFGTDQTLTSSERRDDSCRDLFSSIFPLSIVRSPIRGALLQSSSLDEQESVDLIRSTSGFISAIFQQVVVEIDFMKP